MDKIEEIIEYLCDVLIEYEDFKMRVDKNGNRYIFEDD